MRKRMLVGALAALAMTTAAAPAGADPIGVEGCYGVSVVICNPTVNGVSTSYSQVPVCAGTCTVINVPRPRVSQPCVSYQDYYGTESGTC
jgi:uncharacterized membrane protein